MRIFKLDCVIFPKKSYNMSDKYKHYSRHSNSLLSYSSRKRTNDEPDSKRSKWARKDDCSDSREKFDSSSYPKELLDLFQSSECELCDVQFSAPVMSKMHYSGKNHMRKVSRFMERWSLKTGIRIPRIKGPESPNTELTREYCEICDVEMLTLNEKILHISGKKHIKNLNDPTKHKKRAQHHSEVVKYENSETTDSSKTNLRCKPCKISFKNNQDMEEHMKTNKHKISLLNQEHGDRIIPGLELWYCMPCKEQYQASKDYTEHLFTEKHMTLEMCRANTELFYCNVCDLFMEQEEKDGHMNKLEHRRKSLRNFSMELIKNMAHTEDNTLYYSCPDCPNAGSMSFIEFNAHLLTDEHTDIVLKRQSAKQGE